MATVVMSDIFRHRVKSWLQKCPTYEVLHSPSREVEYKLAKHEITGGHRLSKVGDSIGIMMAFDFFFVQLL